MRDFFLGPWRYWAVLAAMIAVLWTLGQFGTHVRHFVPFSFAVLGLAGAAVAVILLTYRRGENVTRDDFDELVGDE